MKQMTVFFIMLALALGISFRPVDLDAIRTDEITVIVEGEVENSGEVHLPLYSTISDALEAASPTEDADLSSLNPQTVLSDHDIVRIPVISEETAAKVSINTAGFKELCTLPGIGESTAQRIIDYRENVGLFSCLEDLMNVKGIGTVRFEKLKDLICL